jgi:hypothetical protein
MPWYKQTAVWGVIISVTALLLSQLPPIVAWVPSKHVSAEVGSRIGLPNAIGIPGFQMFIDLKNSGNRAIDISNLTLDLTYPNGNVRHLRAQAYSKILSGQPNAIDFPITSIALSTGSSWAELVSFYSDFTPSDEEELSKMRLEFSQDIFSKMQARGGKEGPLIVAAQPLIDEASRFFDKKFDLEKGKYGVSLKCNVNGKEVVLKQASFTLYDYHISMIEAQKDDFKYGAGIYYPISQSKQAWALLAKED